MKARVNFKFKFKDEWIEESLDFIIDDFFYNAIENGFWLNKDLQLPKHPRQRQIYILSRNIISVDAL